MSYHPSIAVTSLSGTLPGSATVWATDEDHDKAYAFRVLVERDEGPEAPWKATAEAAGNQGQGSSHLGPYEAVLRAMQDALDN